MILFLFIDCTSIIRRGRCFIGRNYRIMVLYNKLVIPPERFSAAVFTYHLSILMSIVGITQVPYTAVIIGHEK